MGEVASNTRKSTTIGDLPNDILYKILELMAIQYAAKSTILSKQWKQLWSTLPHLVFDDLFLKYASEKAATIIHKILMQHIGPILGFHLMCYTDALAESDVDQCIIFLSNHGIEKLTLYYRRIFIQYALPDSVYTCSTLTQLKLYDCIFKLTDSIQFPCLVSLILHNVDLELPQTPLKGFDSLISLEIWSITCFMKSLVTLISRCALLEQLVMLQCSDLSGNFEINAPMLRSFEFTGNVKCISFKNSPLLTKLSLMEMNYYPWLELEKCHIAKSFQSFSSLERLSLCNNSLKDQINYQPLILPLSNVFTYLVISVKLTVVCALFLLARLPYLQYIEIQGTPLDNDFSIQKYTCEVEGFPCETLNRLTNVKLISATGSKHEMQLIRILLAKSPILVRMVIEPWLENDDLHEDLRRTNKISAALNFFQRASPRAQVVYNIDRGSKNYFLN